eukprot:GEMP01076390.1.p1 GENE.GEMP01076390.1~~GEMP01076390.1.p1  ORF type:complete len:128 (+),score=25.66 GEMP01076390.1:42-425(+)
MLWLIVAVAVGSSRLDRILRCDNGDPFWPRLRRALQGPKHIFEPEVVALANHKWGEFQDWVDEIERSSTKIRIPSPDGDFLVQSNAYGIVKAIQNSQLDLYFGSGYIWDNELFHGFLACPSGFLIVQ